ncbi:MAG TPA: hypothetical protein VLX09_13965 [Stellaceae bacterium]|nr:hypothetical protein [Stellaceae bacterium]
MGTKFAAIAAAMMVISPLVALSPGRSALGQASRSAHDIPQAVRIEHEETLRQLSAIARRQSRTGEIARKALPVFKEHFQREEEYILPPLTLAPAIAEGRVTPDMRWAIAMADRIKADSNTIFTEHTVITEWMNELATAAERSHERDVVDFARGAVADSLYDVEVTEPAAIVIGEYLRAKLPPGP